MAETLKPAPSNTFYPPAAASANAQRARQMLTGEVSAQSPGMDVTEKLAAGEPVDFNTIRMMKSYFDTQCAAKERIEAQGDRMLEWMLWGGDEGRTWADTVVGQLELLGKELLAKEAGYAQPYAGGGIDGGIHCHTLIRGEGQTFSDGAHQHLFLIPTLSSQAVLVSTGWDGRHRHPMDQADSDFVMDGRSDHRHLVTIPVDIQLPDGTELRAGQLLLTQSDGLHRHGADRLHGTNTDGAHPHELWLSESLAVQSLDVRALQALLAGPMPIPMFKEQADTSDRGWAAAAMGQVSKELVLKEEEIQELHFDRASFEDKEAVAEWLVESGYPGGHLEDTESGPWVVKLRGPGEFDHDTIRRAKVGAGVTALVGNRREAIGKQSVIERLEFPAGYPAAEAHAYAERIGVALTGLTQVPSGILHGVTKEQVIDARTLVLEGGVRARVGVRKSAEDLAVECIEKELPEHVTISKADDEKQIVYGVVLEPDFVDEEGDTISEAEIVKASHAYMKKSRVVKFRHKNVLKTAHVVESYVAPQDLVFDGIHGIQTVRKGTWVIGVHIEDKEMWADVKAKKLQGFSVGGRSYRSATPA